jgi:hypothetical protein
MDCELCRQTQHRRCMTTFSTKYLAGDSLKAKCGARIRLEVIDRRTGETIPGDMLRDTQVEVWPLPWSLFRNAVPLCRRMQQLRCPGCRDHRRLQPA